MVPCHARGAWLCGGWTLLTSQTEQKTGQRGNMNSTTSQPVEHNTHRQPSQIERDSSQHSISPYPSLFSSSNPPAISEIQQVLKNHQGKKEDYCFPAEVHGQSSCCPWSSAIGGKQLFRVKPELLQFRSAETDT